MLFWFRKTLEMVIVSGFERRGRHPYVVCISALNCGFVKMHSIAVYLKLKVVMKKTYFDLEQLQFKGQ